MAERIEIFTAQGEPQGVASRADAHRLGLWHRAVNVFLFRSDGRLLIQKRSGSKDICPDAWDLSTAEHLKPGETYSEAAIRGVREELGIELTDLEPLGDVTESQLEWPGLDVKDYELQKTFRAVSDQPTFASPDEVGEIALVSPGSLRESFRKNPNDYTPWFKSCALAYDIAR